MWPSCGRARVSVSRGGEHGGNTYPAAGRRARSRSAERNARHVRPSHPTPPTPATDDQARPGPLAPVRDRRRAAIPALLLGALGGARSAAPEDSGVVACAYPLATQDVAVGDYTKIRAEFAGSRWPDLRSAGTAYVDLAMRATWRDVHRRVRDRLVLPAVVRRLCPARTVSGSTVGSAPCKRPYKRLSTVSPHRSGAANAVPTLLPAAARQRAWFIAPRRRGPCPFEPSRYRVSPSPGCC